ncbi:MAG: hypothetical protein ACXVCP_17270 [Bdellovibrio sp.]
MSNKKNSPQFVKIFFLILIFNGIFLNGVSSVAQIITFDPNQKELNLPFKYNNGRFYLHLDALNPKKPVTTVQEIAKCEIKNVQVMVYKGLAQKYGKIITTINGMPITTYYPFVLTKTVTKEALGQYSTAVDVMQFLGITQVDSLKIYAVDPNPANIATLIFFYDADGDLIDRTIFLKNQWQRCN